MAQTILHVLSRRRRSLRDAILSDARISKFGLKVSEQKRPTRSPGWSKLHSTTGADGAINIQWLGEAQMLLCRVVTRGGGDPAPIVGDLVRYLLARHRRSIISINVILD